MRHLALALLAGSLCAQPWQPVPIVKQSTRDAGHFGGEGGQWPRAIAISHADPTFLLYFTDVGGIYRSTNGGRMWEPAMVGWNSRGGNAIAIDPRNPDHVLGVGGNSTDRSGVNGVYVSHDRAASWKHVLKLSDAHDGSVAFDPSSYDSGWRHCRTAYFASKTGGIYKSTDGGETWIRTWPGLNKAKLEVHPVRGLVYATVEEGSDAGFWRSIDGGMTFTRTLNEAVHGLDVVASLADRVYISNARGVLVSENAGESFAPVAANAGLPAGQPVRNITVSPADPRRMFAWYQGANWQWRRYYSHDAGANWRISTFDNTHATLPYNVREGFFAPHPTEPDTVWSVGGDWITRSADGGAKYAWDANGINVILVGGHFNISPSSPNTVFFGSQDYNGALTADGGATWNYFDVSGKGWGGYDYGGYTADGVVLYAGDAQEWKLPRRLRISRDSGRTWSWAKTAAGGEVVYAGPDISFSDPTNPDVLFASNWRSTDRGLTWSAMSGCDGVYTWNADNPKEIFGRKGNDVVRSNDGGATWARVATSPGPIDDIAWDWRAKLLYIATGGQIRVWDGQTLATSDPGPDQFGNRRYTTVAVDPVDPAIVYAGAHCDLYACDNAVRRLYNGRWTNLVRKTPLDGIRRQGPHEVQTIRVHPTTREAWVAGQCYGLWKIAAPKPLTVTNAGSFAQGRTSPDAIASAFGTNLAAREEWVGDTLADELAGVRARVTDSAGRERTAKLFYAGPGQVNLLVPGETGLGHATVEVEGAVATVAVEAATPGIFTANQSGSGLPAGSAMRVQADDTRIPVALDALDLGAATDWVYLTLYATGARTGEATATIGGLPALVTYSGPQGAFAGLDQINVRVPRELRGRGVVDLEVTVGNTPANKVQINVR